VENIAKPKVLLPANCIYSSFDYEVKKQSPFIEVLEKLPFTASAKKLWLIKTNFPIKAEVVGPQSIKDQVELINIMKKYKPHSIYIDGSLDRKSIVLSSLIQSVLVVGSASFGSITKIKDEFSRLLILSKIGITKVAGLADTIKYFQNDEVTDTKINSLFDENFEASIITNSDWVYFPGAITDRIYEKIKLKMVNKAIIFRHSLNIHLSHNNLKKMMNNNYVTCVNSFKIDSFYVNSFSPQNKHLDAERLRKEIRSSFSEKVIDITEIVME